MELFSSSSLSPILNKSQSTHPSSLSTSENHQVSSLNTFESLGLVDWICSNTKTLGYKTPTSIQRVCVPAILSGRDIIGCSETGSGKTAAFALPILQDLSKDPFGIFAIVLTPTRELAIQIAEQFNAFGVSLSLRVCLIIGGLNFTEQSLQLSKRPHIVRKHEN